MFKKPWLAYDKAVNLYQSSTLFNFLSIISNDPAGIQNILANARQWEMSGIIE